MRRIRRMSVLVTFCAASGALAAEPIEMRGRLDEVTVYRGQALVTRMLDLSGPGGLVEVVVTELPPHVVPGSIHAESANGVQVRSVRYRVRPVMEDVREEVRELDQQIRTLQDKLTENERHLQLMNQQREYLARLEQFVAPTATVELTQGVLNAETLLKLTTFIGEHREALTNRELELGFQRRDLDEQSQLLQRKRNELTGSSSRTVREAVVFVNKEGDQNARLRIRYLVDNATWTPSYSVRAEGERGDVRMECNASIQQMSGEDWTDVAMTLSTATPSLVAKAPVLTPLTISLAGPQAQSQIIAGGKGYREAMQELAQKRQTAQSMRNTYNNGGVVNGPGNVVFDLNVLQGDNTAGTNFLAQEWLDANMNSVATEQQNWELLAQAEVVRRSTTQPRVVEEVSVVYHLEGRSTLPSRSDRQLIQIAALPLPADFYKIAIPVMTASVYEEASVVNTSDMVLLSGPVTAYLDGQFVGHCEVPTVASGERFTVGFGIDSSLRVSRELVEKTESTQGGNRIVDFKYRLALENFNGEPTDVRLFDRIPQVRGSEIKLTMVDTGPELSDDEAYRQSDHKKGILRWETQVPASAVGHKALAIEYHFQIEYDKNMTISGMPMATAAGANNAVIIP